TRVAALYAEFWTGQFDAVLDHHRRWSMIIRFLAGLLIVLAVNVYLYFHVHRPLRSLRSGVAAVGSRDLTASVPVQRQDEIGELAGQFNLMVAQLRAAAQENQQLYQALKAAHDDLQQKVADATAELIRRNEELERLNEMLSSAQRETARVQRLAVLGQIVATVAHKIGTPLTAISGHVQLLAEDPQMDPAAKKRVRTILGQIDRMSRIVQDLLTLARKPAVGFTPVDMNTVLEQALNLFRPMLDQQRIELLTEFADNLPTVQGDLLQLQDVFANLIDNALEAMPDGGRLQVRTSPWISTDSGTNRVWVAVEIGDTGHGIAPDHLERVFEPFFTTKKAGQGTGLGLAIALESVQLHGGRLSVDSEVGKGSRFLALLPTAEGLPS
ncbi:MAG: sensor histidine kinase, partial [Nitrospirales bacterium]